MEGLLLYWASGLLLTGSLPSGRALNLLDRRLHFEAELLPSLTGSMIASS